MRHLNESARPSILSIILRRWADDAAPSISLFCPRCEVILAFSQAWQMLHIIIIFFCYRDVPWTLWYFTTNDKSTGSESEIHLLWSPERRIWSLISAVPLVLLLTRVWHYVQTSVSATQRYKRRQTAFLNKMFIITFIISVYKNV